LSEAEHIPVSAYMITFNNARTVEKALQSLTWADEIVVVDSFSTDETIDIVGKYATKVEQRKWPGFQDQYQYASEQCSHPWTVFLDADEEFCPELIAEMREELQRNAQRPEGERAVGYEVHRRTFYLGRWIMHGGWVPDHEIRLYDRRHGTWKGGMHAKVRMDGRVEALKHFCYHYTYQNISDQIKTVDKYSTTEAGDKLAADKRFSLLSLLLSPPARFFRDYFLKRGFLDGLPGLIIAVNTAFYVFNKHAKFWEARQQREHPPDSEANRPRS